MDSRRKKRLMLWIALSAAVVVFAIGWQAQEAQSFQSRYDPNALVDATEDAVRSRLGSPSHVDAQAGTWTYDEHDGSAVLWFEDGKVKRIKLDQR